MTPLDGQYLLTAAQMGAAEDEAIARGATVDSLMTRAGEAVAGAVRRLGSGREVLILCGPGNNGGDGYVAAAALKRAGVPVRVAASGPPRSPAAQRARENWGGPVDSLDDTQPAAILVDALFGTGCDRALPIEVERALDRLASAAHLTIAVDLPSGFSTDRGDYPSARYDRPYFDLTLALGAAKPAHVLQPGAAHCGRVRILDIGVPVANGAVRIIDKPVLAPPGPAAHKYTRGMVAIVSGDMAGAARLAAVAALRAGAGYVALLGGEGPGGPDALVHRPLDAKAIGDPRIGTILIGPGLGRIDRAREHLATVLATEHPLVIDGDALRLLDLDAIKGRRQPVILTPHAGEFDALFGKSGVSQIERATEAAGRSGATIVFKGATTVIAGGDGSAIVSPGGNAWLSTAGTGDVLAGAIAAILAGGGSAPLASAASGVWLHAEAARQLGAAFIADDLASALTAARASL